MKRIVCLTVFVLISLFNYVSAEYHVVITTTAPVVSGGVVNFTAELYDNDRKAEGDFLYQWEDNSLLRHHREIETTNPVDEWAVNYTSAECPPGSYVMQVVVSKYYLLMPFKVTSGRKRFSLTSTFNGNLTLSQNNKTIQTEFVSNSTTVLHEVTLKDSDMEYLNNTATQILTYWFIDCDYYGVTNNLQFLMNYSNVDEQHQVEAFVIPNFDPFPTEPPPTTTTTTTTTTQKPTTTSTTTIKPKPRTKRELDLITNFNTNDPNQIIYKVQINQFFANGTEKYNNSFPFICKNHTIVPISSDTPYGYFTRTINVREPVKRIAVSGNNWIQRSEVLDLHVTCNGSSTFNYCIMFKYGLYNVTGNETCPDYTTQITKCEFPINHYFYDNNVRTIVIIISNDVSTEVYPVTVTLYKVNKQAQVSVVVVPVGFSLVAIVLIIFGVAYYVQNRSRFTIEVADFDFGQHFGELEYKTFTERLKDSFTNAFTRAPIPSGSSEGPVWPTSSNKYDNMS